MNKDRLKELLKQVKSPLEKEFLQKVYPDLNLTPDRAQDLCAQYKINFIPGAPTTIPDFAFPDMKIAIYCDGYEFHEDRDSFSMDRFQSNELQSLGWIVFRFSGHQIKTKNFVEQAVEEIKRAIAQRDKQQQAELEKHQQLERHQQKSIELEEKLRKEQQAKLEKHQQLERHQQKSKVGLYVVAVLGVCLLISTVFLWVQSSKPELPAVYRIDEVVVIPAGEFQMGGSDSDAEIDEHPVHTVDVNAFYIHKYEVTNAQYKNFVDANLQWQKTAFRVSSITASISSCGRTTRILPVKKTIPSFLSAGMRQWLMQNGRVGDCQLKQSGKKLRVVDWSAQNIRGEM